MSSTDDIKKALKDSGLIIPSGMSEAEPDPIVACKIGCPGGTCFVGSCAVGHCWLLCTGQCTVAKCYQGATISNDAASQNLG